MNRTSSPAQLQEKLIRRKSAGFQLVTRQSFNRNWFYRAKKNQRRTQQLQNELGIGGE